MSNRIHNDSPCEQDLSRMSKCGQMYYCTVCSKHVHDLRNKTHEEIEKITAKNKGACAIIHERHMDYGFSKWKRVNHLEKMLLQKGFKRTAFICTLVLVFLTACASRRKRNHVVGYFKISEKNNSGNQVISPNEPFHAD